MSQNKSILVSAEKTKSEESRICQGDIFRDVTIIEDFNANEESIQVTKLSFPFVICLNQDCDLNSDYRAKLQGKEGKDCCLIHYIVAPLFPVNNTGNNHWGNIFQESETLSKKQIERIRKNELPRFHILHFPQSDGIDIDFIIDFKHFFTVSSKYLNSNLNNRLCSIDILYREQVSQRFGNYLTRIGLPGKEENISDKP